MDEVNLHSDKKVSTFLGIKLSKNLTVFLICLVLTTMFWFLNAFTKDYTTQLYFPLNYKNVPKNELVTNELPSFLAVEVNGFGFKLLPLFLIGSLDSLPIDYEKGIKQKKNNTKVSVFSKLNLKGLVNSELPKDIKIESLSIDSLRIFTSILDTKIVEVKLDADFTFDDGYYMKDSFKLSPKKITVSGPVSQLTLLKNIKTKYLKLENISSNISKNVELVFPLNHSSTTKLINVNVEVDRETEKEIRVPIQKIVNLNNKKVKLFPDRVTVKVKVGLSKYDKLDPSQFLFEVKVDELTLSKKHLIIKLVNKPDWVDVISYKPRRVEYILLK